MVQVGTRIWGLGSALRHWSSGVAAAYALLAVACGSTHGDAGSSAGAGGGAGAGGAGIQSPGGSGGNASGGASAGSTSGVGVSGSGGLSGASSMQAGAAGGSSGSLGLAGASQTGTAGASSDVPNQGVDDGTTPTGMVTTCFGSACPHGACGLEVSTVEDCSTIYPGEFDGSSGLCAPGANGQYCIALDQFNRWIVTCSAGSASVGHCTGIGCVYDENAMVAECD